MIGGEWYMDRFTDQEEFITRKCPYCGGKLEIYESDDLEAIICPECSSMMKFDQTEVYND